MKYLVMTAEAATANDLFRALSRQSRYPWVWRKLQSARLHMLHAATREIDEDDVSRGDTLVTNGDLLPYGEMPSKDRGCDPPQGPKS